MVLNAPSDKLPTTDVQHVQQLPLILVQALDLDVEDGVGVQGDPLLALGPAGKGLLVVPLDLLQPGEHRRVTGEAVQVHPLFPDVLRRNQFLCTTLPQVHSL